MRMQQTRRAGITLTEVLVALFIMAIGMIALLVMFPLGAQQIAQAIKDERSAQAANNADNIMRDHWREHVIKYLKSGGTEADLVNPIHPRAVHYMVAMDNPNAGLQYQPPNAIYPLPPTNTTAVVPNRIGMVSLSDATGAVYPVGTTLPENISRPSYPVFVSPYQEFVRRNAGYQQSRHWVAGVRPSDNNATAPSAFGIGVNMNRVPRRTLNFPTQYNAGAAGYDQQNTNWQFRMCTLMDDIDFDEDGNANQGTTVSRGGRYNWDWVLQRPAQGNRLTMNMSIVVYDQRAFNMRRPDDEIAFNLPVNNVNPTILFGSSSIDIPYNTTTNPPTVVPAIRPGQWIMDGTVYSDPLLTNSFRNANFYRVTAVTDVPGAAAGIGRIRIDIQTPIKIPSGTTFASNNLYPVPAQIYVLRGVAEVLERRPLTNEDAPVVP